MKASKMFSLYGVTTAMSASNALLHPASKRKWGSSVTANKKLAAAYERLLPEHKYVPNLKTKSRIEGSDILLDSVLRNNVEWVKKGVACKLATGLGVEIHSGFKVLSDSVVVLSTKSGAKVWLVKTKLATSLIKLHEACLEIYKADYGPIKDFEGVRFPQVAGQQKNTLKEAIGLAIASKANETYRVSDCVQTCNFEMDTVGARVKVQTTMRLTKSAAKPQKFFVIDEPFTVFMTNDDLSEPYFVATFN